MTYRLPATLSGEINELERLIGLHLDGQLEGAALKPHRVPFGVYEQRKENTFMIRIRCAGGTVTPAQLKMVAELSQSHGANFIHVTTRQELQLHDVKLVDVIKVIRQLYSVGLATRGGGGNTVRNIMASPDSGVSLDEVFDVTPYAVELTSRLLAEPDSWLLPRKFKIAFSNSSKDSGYAGFNDLGFIATKENDRLGFKVYLAGGMGAKAQAGHLIHEFIPLEDVYLVTAATKRLFDKHGNRKNKHAARLRFLWNSLGESKFLELYQQEINQLRSEQPQPLEIAVVKELPPDKIDIKRPWPDSAEFQLWRKRYVYEQAQPNLFSVLIPLVLGNLPNEAALQLVQLLSPLGNDVIRASMGQNLRLRNIPEHLLFEVYQLISQITPLAAAAPLLAEAVSCTGADTCKLGICLSKGALTAISKELMSSNLDLDRLTGFRLNISGCPNTCGQHSLADLGFYGKVGRKGHDIFPAYMVVAGGKIGNGETRLAKTFSHISARRMPEFVREVISIYLNNKSNYSSFTDYVDQAGAEQIKQLCQKFHDVPEFDDDKNYYFDWGSRQIFSLAGMGAGECSAGLFDLIDLDLKRIKQLQERLTTESDSDEQSKLLYQIVLSASRMLLVTRGIEVKSDEQVFNSFITHFIKAGLVETKHEKLVQNAKDKLYSDLNSHRVELNELVEAVKTLYAGMDNSLRFPVELLTAKASTTTTSTNIDATVKLVKRDYRGVGCPMNFVKLKMELAKLKSGEQIEIMLDDGSPIENVPRSAAAEGHKIVSQQKSSDAWVVLIEKGEQR